MTNYSHPILHNQIQRSRNWDVSGIRDQSRKPAAKRRGYGDGPGIRGGGGGGGGVGGRRAQRGNMRSTK